MAKQIRIVTDAVSDTAQLNDCATADDIWNALPITSGARIWGDEVYFPIPVDAEPQDAQEEVPSGTLAYWPPGKCFCIFFGQRPASPVNVVGELDGAPEQWSAVREGAQIRIERV
jgi:hypothetical protein